MAYRVGDVVNGHRLGEDNEWHPVEGAAQPAGSPVTGDDGEPRVPEGSPDEPALTASGAAERPWYMQWWVPTLAALALVVVAIGIRTALTTASTSSTSDQPSAAASAQPSVAPSSVPPAPSASAAPPAATAPATPAPSPAPSRRVTTAPAPVPAPATPAPAPAAPAPATPSVPAAAGSAGLNSPVRDGVFEFTVTDVSCGRSEVGTQYLNKVAQGQFCLVSMNVANRGAEPRGFDSSHQRAVDAQGRTVAADLEAGYFIEDSQAFLEPIGPGGQAKGTIAFDIPQASSIAELQLHDSAGSRGAKVKVS